jgi:hypothetical protein
VLVSRLLLILRLRMTRKREGWLVGRAVREIRNNPANRKIRRRTRISSLAIPGRAALAATGAAFGLGLGAMLLVSIWLPTDTSPDIGSMWQIQATLAAAALPILGLIIQLAGDQGQVAARTPEILLRTSWAFLLVALSLTATVLIAVAELVLSATAANWVARVLLLLTVLAAVFAYYRALRTLADPLRVRALANEIAAGRVRASVETSAARRMANNRLLEALNRLGAEYYPMGLRSKELNDWVIVKTDHPQEIVDINIHLLELILAALPPVAAGLLPAGIPADPAKSPPPPVRLLRLIGQHTYSKEPGLLAIPRSRVPYAQDSKSVGILVQRAFQLDELE